MTNIKKVNAAIFDWAGTTVDFGSVAPISAFKKLFKQEGIICSDAECRAPMGSEKREHIKQMLEMPAIAEQWLEAHNRQADEQDIERLYHDFVPIQLEAIRANSKLIPGCLETMRHLKEQAIQIGSNTGYNEEMYNLVAEGAQVQGFKPAVNVCATQVSKGRPYPYMAQAVMEKLGVLDAATCVKIDDTETGLEEGLHAGMWTVGVAISGNAVGLTQQQWEALSEDDQNKARTIAYAKLGKVNPHFIIDSIADLPRIIQNINTKLAIGERP